jgi:hypothetical protein
MSNDDTTQCEGNNTYQEFQQTSGWLQDMQVRYRSHPRTDRRIDQHNVYRQFCSYETVRQCYK